MKLQWDARQAALVQAEAVAKAAAKHAKREEARAAAASRLRVFASFARWPAFLPAVPGARAPAEAPSAPSPAPP